MSRGRHFLPICIRTFAFNVLIGLFCSLKIIGQSNQAIANTALAENIYLQTDGKVYTKDQTIWFRALVTNAANNLPTEFSGVLYVELISPELEVIDKKILKLEKGEGAGFIDLNEQYSTGVYLLRAYTRWNQNFGDAFFYKTYLNIAPYSEENESQKPISNVKLVEESDGFRLKADFNPGVIDSLHINKTRLKVVVTTDATYDTLSLKGKDGLYALDYSMTKGTTVVNLTINTQNQETASRTVLVDPRAFNMTFSPESGSMVHQLVTKVGFVAKGPDGLGRKVKGNIVDDLDRVVSTFVSNDSGVGSFNILPDKARQYFAAVMLDNKVYKSELPRVREDGMSFSLKNEKDGLSLRVQATKKHNLDSIKVQLSHRGLSYYQGVAQLNEAAELLILLPKDNLPSGVVSVQLKDKSDELLAQKLYYNSTPVKRLRLDVQLQEKQPRQREKSDLTVRVTDGNGKPVQASLSILTINKKELGQLQEDRENLLINRVLTSDFKVEIENPAQYFDAEGRPNPKAMADLLAALGYDHYKFTDAELVDNNQPEYSLNVSGQVNGVLNKKKAQAGIDLTMITFGEESEVFAQTTDSLGRFQFDITDQYGKKLNVLIQTANKRGKNKDYEVVLDEARTPEINFDLKKLIQPVDSVVSLLVEKHQERKLIEDAYRSPYEVRDLGEFVVEDYAMTPEREEVTKVHGLPDVVIQGEELREKKASWTYGLYSVLSYTYPDQVRIRRGRLDGRETEFVKVVGSDITLMMVDGNLVRFNQYFLLPNIPVSEIKSFELIKRPKQFPKLFFQLFPPWAPVPQEPAIIAVYTVNGKGIPGRSSDRGLFQGAVPMYSPLREFNAPNYQNLSPQDWIKPDYRALVHWTANQTTDDQGISNLSFYNADHIGEMVVIVEAISANGQIGYEELTYSVRKNKRQ